MNYLALFITIGFLSFIAFAVYCSDNDNIRWCRVVNIILLWICAIIAIGAFAWGVYFVTCRALK